MKFLRDRSEIARKINIENVPVLTMDLTKPIRGDNFYKDCYEGSKVRILGGHSAAYADLPTRCTIAMYGDETGNENHAEPWTYKKIILSGAPVFLKRGFSLDDVDQMVEWSNTKLLKAGDSVIVFFRGKDTGHLRMMKIGSYIDPRCSTVAALEDVEE